MMNHLVTDDLQTIYHGSKLLIMSDLLSYRF